MTPRTVTKQLGQVGRRGLTMIEVTITMTILLVATGGLLQIQKATRMAQVQQGLSLQAQQSARIAISAMVEELRLANPISLHDTDLSAPAGDIDLPYLYFWTMSWDGGDFAHSNWAQYALDGSGTILQRIGYVELGESGVMPLDPATGLRDLTVLSTRTLARNIYREDANDNGVLDAGEDLNGDGLLQRGLRFRVIQEDVNDDDILGLVEDLDGDQRLDGRIIITVDTRVVGQGPLGGMGYATVETVVECRNGDVSA